MTETKQPSTPNHHLRRERERRAWSQQDLADEVGTTPLNVSRWERGVTTPSPYFRQKLCEVFEKNAQELGLVAQSDGTASVVQTTSIDETSPSAPASPESPAKIWNVPYRHNPFFTGREDVLSYLRETLLAGQQPVALTQPQAISGLGGIGKTQTAIEYAYRHREEYQSVFWARAESRDLLISDFLTIAALLNLPQRNDQEQEAIVRAVLHWLDTHEGWLLILDNADTLEIVSEFFPSAGTGHILLTTRSHSLGTLAQRIDLEKMSLDEGLLFLLRRTKQLKGAARLESVSESIRIAAQAIVEALDGLPLALDQAGAYIEETGCSLSDYLKYYKTRQQRLLRTRGRDASGHPEPVATTWSLAFEKVEQANPAAAELLRVCAFLHPDEIPESMIIEGASDLSPVLQSATEDELDWNEAIRQLRRYSLLKRDAEEKILNIHRLVQAVVRDGMSQEERKEQVQRVVLMVNRTFPNGQVESWPVCQRYQPHMLVCADMIKQWQLKSIEATQLLMHGGTYLRERGRYKEAEPLLEQALTIREQTLGPKHLDVARSQEELSKLYFFQGKYAEAEALLKHLLFVYESTLNSEDKEIANVLSDLGVLYHYQGKNREAEPLLLRALHILELTEEGEIAGLLSDLGLVYQSLGDYTQSEQFHQRALALDENKFGLDHINVAGDMNNLAILFFIQGRYIQAEQMRRKALEIAEKTLGPDHLYVSIALANLTTLHIQLERYEEAEPLAQRALQIVENALGPNHLEATFSLDCLGFIYRVHRKYTQAEQLLQRSLSIREQILGPESPYVAQTLNGLALLYRDQSQFEQAEALFQRALAIQEQNLGASHSAVAETLNHLALLYRDQSQFEQAERLFQCALAIQEQSLGPEHPKFVETLKAYADLLHKTNRVAEAQEMEARAQAIRAKQK